MSELPVTTLRISSPPQKSSAAAERSRTRLPAARYLGILLLLTFFVLTGALSWWALLRPVTVTVVPIETNVREQVFGLGVIGARVQSNVNFKVPGVLTRLFADQGDQVSAGQVIAKLDSSDIEAQVALASAGVAQAQASLAKAKTDVTSASATLVNANAMAGRAATLIKQNSIAAEEAQTRDASARVAAANLASAQSLVTVAEAALYSAQAQLAYEAATLAFYSLRAPYDAWIVSRNLELGSSVNPTSASQSVFTMVAANTVWSVGYVDERLAGRIRVGQPAEIVLRSHPNTHIPGHVARIEIQSDAVNEERIVDVAFDQIPETIHLGEQSNVYITWGTLERAILVQASAVADFQGDKASGGRGIVWTVEGGRLEHREVGFGPELMDGRLPILQGLPEKSAVVAAPVSGMRVGRRAQIARAPTP